MLHPCRNLRPGNKYSGPLFVVRRTGTRPIDTPAEKILAYFGTIWKYGSASASTRATEGRAFRRSR